MNYVISIVNPNAMEILTDIHHKLKLPIAVELHGKGTAVRSMLDILGIESTDKRIVFTIASREKTAELIKEQKKRLYIGIPGHGVVITIPMKSIGGGNTMNYLNDGKQEAKFVPDFGCGYELIIAIANAGCCDMVMNEARTAGATGGTVLHGKGTGSPDCKTFLNVSIAQEKEVIFIVAKTEKKSEIMKAILTNAGPGSEAGTIVFSLPASEVVGLNTFDVEQDEKE